MNRDTEGMNAMKLRMRNQLLLAFSVVLALMLISSAVVFFKATVVAKKLDYMQQNRVPILFRSTELDYAQMKARSDVRRAVLFVATGKMDGAKEYRQKLEDDWTIIDADLATLRQLSPHFALQVNKDRVSQLGVELPVLHREQAAIIDRALGAGRGRIAAVDDDLTKNCEPHGAALRTVIQTFTKSVEDLTVSDVDTLLQSQSQSEWILAISTLLALSAGIGIAILFSGRVVGALAPVVERLKAIAAGDLSGARLNEALLTRHDELGELAAAAQTMAESLRRLLSDITTGVQTLASSATELSSISRETATGTASMSERAQTVATAAEEASANTSSIAAGMEQSSSSLASVASATEQMSATVGDISANTARANAISEQATSQARSITEQMQKLGQAAQEIGQVTETINNISAQTNLLALNATIEAARAGAAGKGFAVVANEIKELARQTAEATEDIKGKISGMQGSTGAAIADIGQIATVIRDVGGIVASIAAAIEQQAAATRDVAGNIAQASAGVRDANERVSHTAQVSSSIAQDIAGVHASVSDIRHGGEQVQASASELSKLAEVLGARVAQFSL